MSQWSDLIDEHLADLYDQVPDIACKGLCHDACGPIDMHPRERQRIRQAGVRIPPREQLLLEMGAVGSYDCPALINTRCSVYELRPMICRVYAASEALPCGHGCQPTTGRLLTNTETQALVEASKNPEGTHSPVPPAVKDTL